MAKTAYTLCQGCGKAHAPHIACRQVDIIAMDEERRKAKKIKTQLRPKYIANFRKPKQPNQGKR